MAKIIPFQAVRPTKDKVSLVVSNSLETYSEDAIASILEKNPYSFLQIINPSHSHHKGLIGKQRYHMVRNKFMEFKDKGLYMKDSLPCFYVYKINNNEGASFTGIIAAASCEDYKNNKIRKHEDTIVYRETIFKNYLKTVGFNAEPVLLTYPDNEVIDAIIKKAQQTEASYRFTTASKDRHYLWTIDDEQAINKITKAFETINALYIADGHHRCASSKLLAEELRLENERHTGNEPYNFFMSYLIPESELKIYEFNRLVTDLNGLGTTEFLMKLKAIYHIENRGDKPFKPTKKHEFGMYLDGNYYALSLKKELYDFKNPQEALDTQLLYTTILNPILGIIDLRYDERIAYSYARNDWENIKKRIDLGRFKVGFGMMPIAIEELKTLADEGLTMPPKSTFIEPKLLSGLTIYEF